MKKETDFLALWAREVSMEIMFLDTQQMEEEETIAKIDNGIKLCRILGKADFSEMKSHDSISDVETFIAVQKITSSESSSNYQILKRLIGQIKDAENFLIKVREDPKKHYEETEEYQLYFSRLSRLLAGI